MKVTKMGGSYTYKMGYPGLSLSPQPWPRPWGMFTWRYTPIPKVYMPFGISNESRKDEGSESVQGCLGLSPSPQPQPQPRGMFT